MKIVVKYWTTEIEVSDNNAADDGRGLIYHNQQYTLQLLEKIVEEIHKLNKGGEK
jgi:hypothetical protein